MTITLCGSIKFFEKMVEVQAELEKLGHTVFMPVKADGVDYWAADNTSRVEAKKGQDLMGKHFRKIEGSDAILVVNMTKGDIENYIGANTFLEIGYAHYLGKKVFMLNPAPDQPYIIDEIQTVDPVVVDGDLTLIS